MSATPESPRPEVLTPGDVEEIKAGNGTVEPGSLKDRLRERRRELSEDRTLDLKVPGYDGDLAIRYHAMDGDRITAMSTNLRRSGRDMNNVIDSAADMLIEACEVVLVRDKPDADLEPLTAGDADIPVGFDPNLAEFFGIEFTSSRDTVMAVFSPEGNRDLVVVDHTEAIIQWGQGRQEQIADNLLGE